MTAPVEFRLHDAVRLLECHGSVDAGALGRILGRWAREINPMYLVRFNGQHVRTVRFDEIVLADELANVA